jgi:hypothetical protein
MGDDVFYGCTNLQSIGEMPLIESIPYFAFGYCGALKTVGVNWSKIKSIGANSFAYCYNLELSLGDMPALSAIEEYAFVSCTNLNSIGVMPRLTSLGSYAFWGCKGLLSVGDFPLLREIGNHSFADCYSLKTITLPQSIPVSLSGPLQTLAVVLVPTNLLEVYQQMENWKDVAGQLLPIGEQTEFDINVTAQEDVSSFYDAIGEENLPHVISLKVSGTINGRDISYIRNKMRNLRDLDLSDTKVVANSFAYYAGSTTSEDDLGENVFRGVGLVSVKLPKALKRIAPFAFYNCGYLKEVVIPDSVKGIGRYAFNDCDNLRQVILPQDLEYIESGAFWSCGLLSTINWPRTLNLIGDNAFNSCNLTSLVLPPHVRRIEHQTFYNNPITSVILPDHIEYIFTDRISFNFA